MGLNSVITKLLLVLIIVTFVSHTYCQKSNKFFRQDYTYFSDTESFYKIQTLKKSWREAKRWCEMEGATLFYPEDDAEAKTMTAFWNLTQPHTSQVFIGISDLLSKGIYETIDGRPVSDVYRAWSAGEPNDAGGVADCVILGQDELLHADRCDTPRPFICRKQLADLHWNQDCDMASTDYVFNADLGSCYKFHIDPKNWTEAFKVCFVELSYLAIINSPAEAAFLVNLAMRSKKDRIPGVAKPAEVLLGFHNRYGDGWETVKGEKLEESGYATWGDKNPDGGDNEQCGSMFFNHVRPQFNGQLNDLGCHERNFYICEHDIGSQVDSIDERFNT